PRMAKTLPTTRRSPKICCANWGTSSTSWASWKHHRIPMNRASPKPAACFAHWNRAITRRALTPSMTVVTSGMPCAASSSSRRGPRPARRSAMQAENEWGLEQLTRHIQKIETLATRNGLDFHPVDFELVPNTFMMEVAVYGLPIRMPHWSFGVRYIHQQVQHRMGGSHIFEVVFPGNPNRAYLVTDNGLAQNTLVTAHVLGHADFSKNNALFARMQQQVGYHIVTEAAERARSIQDAIEEHGLRRVEMVLDAALALEQHIDVDHPIHRPD